MRDLLRKLMFLSLGMISHTLTLITKATRSTEPSVHMCWTTGGHTSVHMCWTTGCHMSVHMCWTTGGHMSVHMCWTTGGHMSVHMCWTTGGHMSVHMCCTTGGHIPGDSNPHRHHRASLQSGTHNFWFKLNLKLSLGRLPLAMLRSELKDWRLVSAPVTNLCSQAVSSLVV